MTNFILKMRTRAWYKNVISLLLFALIISNICIIFMFSNENGETSGERSEGVSQSIAEIVVDGFEEMKPDEQQVHVNKIHLPVRKIAHFSIFASLGGLTALLFYSLELRRWYFTFLIPLAFALFNAIVDETHQLFSPGRSGNPTDVLIDFSGACLSVLVINLCAYFIIKYKGKRSEKRAEDEN